MDDTDVENETTLTKMKQLFDDAFHSSCEVLMIKSIDIEVGYLPSKRSDSWLKFKQDYVEGLNDSLDLVHIGAWYSPFLMACYDPDTEEYQNMKEFFVEEKMLPINEKPHYYQTGEERDMWFTPELVWEIRGVDFTVSLIHHAAMGLVHPIWV
ncbi:DNA ligase 6 isoform X1 [Tanacetum coccineum]